MPRHSAVQKSQREDRAHPSMGRHEPGRPAALLLVACLLLYPASSSGPVRAATVPATWRTLVDTSFASGTIAPWPTGQLGSATARLVAGRYAVSGSGARPAFVFPRGIPALQDGRISATFILGGSGQVGLVARAGDAGSQVSLYALWLNGKGTLGAMRCERGACTTLFSTTAYRGQLPAGRDATLAMAWQGSTPLFSLNGHPLAYSYPDRPPLPAGAWGIYVNSTRDKGAVVGRFARITLIGAPAPAPTSTPTRTPRPPTATHAPATRTPPPALAPTATGTPVPPTRVPEPTAGATPIATPATPATAGVCPIFPASNVWNRDISALPVAANSAQLIGAIGLDRGLFPDFGTDPTSGISYLDVPPTQPKVPVQFDVADESDPGPYPMPAPGALPPGDSNYLLLLDRQSCYLYELYTPKLVAGTWHAFSGAIWNLRSNALRPDGRTSADAAGLPIFPGLVRYDEVAAGLIAHALRFTAPHTRKAHLYPARHDAGERADPGLPPMGLRVRLKASVDISGFSPQAQVVLQALKTYGMLLADNGEPWYITGAPDSRWNDDDLHEIERITGADLEVVDTSTLFNGG